MQNHIQNSQKPELTNQKQMDKKLIVEVNVPPDHAVELVCHHLDQEGNLRFTEILKTFSEKDNKKEILPSAKIWKRASSLAFLLALVVYMLVRLIGVQEFPIYFFSDEAIQSVHAADLIRDGFYSPYDEFLPTFFQNGGQYNLSTSVYLQVIPVGLFGKEIWATRGAAALVTILAAVGVGCMIEKGVKQGWGWLGVLVLSLMPAWFLHSRTAFETALAVSFYAGFLGCYVVYRKGDLRFLYAAAVFAALAFYSYNPMRIVVGLTLLGFLLSDWRYHWQHKAIFLKAFGIGLVFLIPFLRFSLDHPGEELKHLEILGSYWVHNISPGEKLLNFVREYVRGLNPVYWFLPNQVDLQRHLMKDYGHLWQPGLPFLVAGMLWCVRHYRQPFPRLVLITLLAAPSGAALAGLGITRALGMVIPASVLTTIGLVRTWEWLLERIQKTRNQTQQFTLTAGVGVLVLLVVMNFRMLSDALRNGPTWFTNYGLYGMQYGAQQVFGTIKDELKNNPEKKFNLTSTWSNGADVLARFFFDDPVPFQMSSIDGYISEFIPIDPEIVFVMTPEEMQNMRESQKFTNIQTDRVINYPNGEPGFYFTRLDYIGNIEVIFTEELTARRSMNKGIVQLADGEEVQVEYSTLDMGEILHIFDGDRSTLSRSWEANPLQLIVRFSEPRMVSQLLLRVGGEPTRVEAKIWADGAEVPIFLEVEVPEASDPRFVDLDLPETIAVDWAEVWVFNLNNAEPAHVHLWELQFYPLIHIEQ